MKKLLTILSSFALTTVGVSTVVACNKVKTHEKEKENKDNEKPLPVQEETAEDIANQKKVNDAVEALQKAIYNIMKLG